MKLFFFLIVLDLLTLSADPNGFKLFDELYQAKGASNQTNLSKEELALLNYYPSQNAAYNMSFQTPGYAFEMDGYTLHVTADFRIASLSPEAFESADLLASMLKTDDKPLDIYYAGGGLSLNFLEGEQQTNNGTILWTSVVCEEPKSYAFANGDVYSLFDDEEPQKIGNASDRTIHSKKPKVIYTQSEMDGIPFVAPEKIKLKGFEVEEAVRGLIDYLSKGPITQMPFESIMVDGITEVDNKKAYSMRTLFGVSAFGQTSQYAVLADKKVYKYTFKPSLVANYTAEVRSPKQTKPTAKQSCKDAAILCVIDEYEHFVLGYMSPRWNITGSLTPELGAEIIYQSQLAQIKNPEVQNVPVARLTSGEDSYNLVFKEPCAKFWIYFNGVDQIDGEEVLVYNIDNGRHNYAISHDKKIYAYNGKFELVGELPAKKAE